MTTAGLAKLVYRSESLVKAWESGRRVPQPEDLRRLDEIFDAKGLLEEIGRELVKDERAPEYMDKWREVEGNASSLSEFNPLLFPGIVQTPDYAREILLTSGRQIDDAEE